MCTVQDKFYNFTSLHFRSYHIISCRYIRDFKTRKDMLAVVNEMIEIPLSSFPLYCFISINVFYKLHVLQRRIKHRRRTSFLSPLLLFRFFLSLSPPQAVAPFKLDWERRAVVGDFRSTLDVSDSFSTTATRMRAYGKYSRFSTLPGSHRLSHSFGSVYFTTIGEYFFGTSINFDFSVRTRSRFVNIFPRLTLSPRPCLRGIMENV